MIKPFYEKALRRLPAWQHEATTQEASHLKLLLWLQPQDLNRKNRIISSMNKKILIVSLGIFLIGASVYWQGKSVDLASPLASPATDSKLSVAGQDNKSNRNSLPVKATSINTPATFDSVEDEVMLTEQDRQDLRDWYRGDSVRHQDYAAYDEASLLALADNGDVMAMKTLVLHYDDMMTKTANSEELLAYSDKAKRMIEKAIIFGDREFLDSIPALPDATSKFSSPDSTAEEKQESMIEALALAEFMGMRGDLESKYHRQALFFDIYKDRGAPDALSDQEKQAIRQRAREIYDSYEQKRIKFGLGPFDNSIPEGVRKQFEIERQKYIEKMGDKAIL